MICPNCGAQVSDSAAFCPKCGTPLAAQAAPVEPTPAAPAPSEPAPAPEQAAYQQQAAYPQQPQPAPYTQQAAYQQAAYQQQPAYQQASVPLISAWETPLAGFKLPSGIGELFTGYNKAGAQYAEAAGLKMKWYKALTTVLLYISAISLFWTGLDTIFGFTGSSFGYSMYASHPALKVIDIVYGIYLVAFAFVVLYIRMRLAKFATDGPHLYLLLLVVNGSVSILYTLATYAIVGYSFAASIIGSVIGLAVIFFLNKTYFDKRQYFFTM